MDWEEPGERKLGVWPCDEQAGRQPAGAVEAKDSAGS